MTIDLPVFDRNQGGVAGADATRDVLHAQYQAALDAAAGQVQSLTTNIAMLQSNLAQATKAAQDADETLKFADDAYAKSSIDERAFADYETAALDREIDMTDTQTALTTDELALQIELGLGFPQMRIATAPGVCTASSEKVCP